MAPDSYYHPGVLAADRGQWLTAVTWLQEALARDPEWTAVRFQLGKAYEALGELNLARAEYETAVELEGEKRDRQALAVLCERMECLAVSKEQYRQILSMEPNNTWVTERFATLSDQ